MGALDDEFEFVAASVERAARLQREICEEASQVASLRAPALLRHLDLLYGACDSHLAARRAGFATAPDDTAREAAIVDMRSLLWIVRDFQRNLAWVNAAQTMTLDLGTTYFIERITRQVIAPDAEVCVVPIDKGSYATHSDPWRHVIESWGSGIPSTEPTVVVVYVPRREQRSGLLHPLIVHELGHAIDGENAVVGKILTEASSRAPFARRFSAAVTQSATSMTMPPNEAAQLLAERLEAWVAEGFCDAVATQLLGPTYLYSFIAEVGAGTMDEAGPKHPPARERIAAIVSQLDKAGWAKSMNAQATGLDAWIRALLMNKPRHSGVEGFLVWAVRYVHAIVGRHAKNAVGRAFAPEAGRLEEVAQLLTAGVPPAQSADGAAVAAETVILGAWFSALGANGGDLKAVVAAADSPQLSRLLPAALELGAIAEYWSAP